MVINILFVSLHIKNNKLINKSNENIEKINKQRKLCYPERNRSRKCPDGVKYSEWREEKDRQQTEAIRNLVPEVGLGCTVCYYSDRRAATVTKIISPCKIEVTFNQTECIDYYAGDYRILPELEGGAKVFTKRRNGRWVADGQAYKDGVLLMLHYQSHYIDPHF